MKWKYAIRYSYMFECIICGKKLRVGKNLNAHFWTNKCLKVTNELWYQRDLLLQKIEKGDNTDETLGKHKELDDLYNSYMKFKLDSV